MDAACSIGIAAAAFTTRTVTGSAPTFGTQSIADQTHDQHSAIAAVTLPAATGGDGTLTYSLTPGLPAGLKFGASTRRISGTPTAARAETTHTYTATDADGDAATLTFDLTVNADTTPALSSSVSNQSYRQNVQISTLTLPAATGGNGALTYSLTPAPPAGLTFSASTRRVTGIPTVWHTAKTYSFTVTDADGDTDSETFTITVASWTTLTASNIGATGATLTIGNHGGAWYYKHTTPATGPGASCSSEVALGTATATVSNLAADTAHVFKAYSDSSCSALLATASSFTTLLAKVSNVSVSARDGALAVTWDAQSNATGYEVQWKSGNEEWSSSRQASASGASHTITTLTNATEYTVRVRSNKSSPANTGEWSDAAKGTPADETLTVSAIGSTGATLTIGNYGGSWHHRHTTPSTGPGASCSATAVPAGTDNTTVSGLSPGTAHVFKAYSDGGCATELATAASFTTLLAKVANVRVSARDKSLAVTWDARTGATGYDVQWKSGNEEWSATRQSSATGTSATITTLTNAVEYTIRVRWKKGGKTGEWSDTAKGTPADETLTVSNIGSTGATLTIGNHGGAWYYKHTTPSAGPGASCSATAVPAGTDNTTVSGLSPDTAHVFKAYSDGACTNSKLLATASSFTTLLAKVANVSVSARDRSLAVTWDARTGATGYDVQWKSGNEEWSATRQSSATGTAATITTLTNAVEYTVRVRWRKGAKTGEWSDEAKGTPADETLTVSNIGATGATLTIGNYGGSWHYRHTTPSTGPGASCSATAVPAGTDKTTVSGLTADTAHVFKAYSDSGCATELATASSFTTLLAKVTNVTVSARDKSLAVTWDAQSNATGYDVEWKSGAEEWSDTRRASVTTGATHTIPTLANSTEYTVRVRSRKSSPANTGEWSDAAKGTPADETLTVSAIGATGATLTIGNHGGAWRHKYTSPNGGTCSSEVAVGTSSATVSTLTADTAYTFKAYSDGGCATELAASSSFTTLLAKVTNVTVSARRDKSLAVTWDAQTGATGYDVQWKSGNEDVEHRPAGVRDVGRVAHDSDPDELHGVHDPGAVEEEQPRQHRRVVGRGEGDAGGRDADGKRHRRTIPTLTNSTEYTVRVRWRKGGKTGEWSDTATGTPAGETLTVSNIGATGATLTIGNYGGSWHYRHTTPSTGPGASCSATAVPAGTDKTTVSGLTADTAHVFKAYSDGGCATELATASSFTTLLAKVANVTVSARDKSLAVTWDAQTGATGYEVQWKSGNEEWSAGRQASVTSGESHTITTLTNAVEYTVRVRWKKGAKTGEWSDEAKGTPAGETLTVSGISATGATLTIGNYGGSWHYRHTTPSTGPGASCSSAAVSAGTDKTTVSGLTADTAYTFKAYSDGTCATELATASSFTTLLAKVSNVSVSARDGALAVSWDAQTGATGYEVQWKSGNEEWSAGRQASVTSGESHTIPTLTNSTEYTVRVRWKKGGKTGEWSDTAKGTPADETLTVSNIGATGATLTIGNYGGSWHYRHTTPSTGPGASCSATAVPAGTDNTTVSGLSPDTAHVFKAYSDGTCSTLLAAASSFTTLLAKVANVTVSARDKSLAVTWDAQTGATGYEVQWKSGNEDWSATRQSSATGTAATITTLTNAVEYTVRVRWRKGAKTGEWSDEAKGTPAGETLTVSAITSTGATLTIGNHGGAWRYKYTSPNGGTCSSEVAAGTSSATVSTLTADTAYTFKAYSDGTCATELATASSFTTLLAKVANVRVSARDKSLAVSWDAQSNATGYDVEWKSGAEEWSDTRRASVTTGATHTIPTLANATEYTVRVRSKKSSPANTGEWSDAAKGTPADETLTVSAIGATGATLTIGNYGGAWHHKHTTPSNGTCSSTAVPAGTDRTTVSGLSPDTAHVFKAYSDSGCATELAAASSFTTLLAKVANVSVSARDRSLAVTWDAQSNATGYDVEWKSGAEEWSDTAAGRP